MSEDDDLYAVSDDDSYSANKKRPRKASKSKPQASKPQASKAQASKSKAPTVDSVEKGLRGSKKGWVKRGGHITIPSVVKGCDGVLKPIDEYVQGQVEVDEGVAECVMQIIAFACQTYEDMCIGDSYGEMAYFVGGEAEGVLAQALGKLPNDPSDHLLDAWAPCYRTALSYGFFSPQTESVIFFSQHEK